MSEQQSSILDRAPIAKLGDWTGETVRCMRCGGEHIVEGFLRDGEVDNTFQFVICGDRVLLVDINGRTTK